jgi:hypothetical protein
MSAQSYTDSAAATEPVPSLSRRSMLRGAAGAGAAGLAAAAVASAATPALAAATSAVPAARSAHSGAGPAGAAEPVVVHLRDARSGEMDIFAGTSYIRLRDPDLAARLTRAVR